jgi:flagellar secretion chaperone FliS
MSYQTHSNRYLENDILSRSPEWLVPLLYEHLLQNLRRASVHLEVGNEEAKRGCLDKASEIVGELLASLDMEKGGEIAARLASLYAYFAVQLMELGEGDTEQVLPRVTGMVEELREAWVLAAQEIAPRGPTRTIPA